MNSHQRRVQRRCDKRLGIQRPKRFRFDPSRVGWYAIREDDPRTSWLIEHGQHPTPDARYGYCCFTPEQRACLPAMDEASR